MDEISDTVGEQAFRKIRGDIVSGDLRPGQKLKLEQLKSKYGVSVSTLREILNRLTTEDLVVGDEAALYADGAYSSPRSRALVARTGMADRVQRRGAKHKRLGPENRYGRR